MTENMILNCVTVDDEPPALNLVSTFVEETPFLKLTGRFDNATKAFQTINTQPVDLVFLDIQMPNLNGIELATLLNREMGEQVRVIFTTAYNQFATESYQVEALDYLLKPFSYSDFLKAATRARNYFQEQKKIRIIEQPADNDFMFVKSDYKLVRIDFDAILFIESLNGYVRIHLAAPQAPVATITNLKTIEERLPAGRFIRIHRSFIVAIGKISSIGKNALQIENHEIPIGDLYKDTFHESLTRWS